MKILKAAHMERCIGCFLCLLEAGRAESRVSLNSPLIRLVPKGAGFEAVVDETAVGVEVEKVAQVCPRNCLSVAEV